jgi:hypothetical protein
MIVEICYKPACLLYIRKPSIYFGLYRSSDYVLYGYAALTPRKDKRIADFHIEILKFSHSILRDLKDSADRDFQGICREKGIKRVVGKKTDKDSRWPKFIRHFGFREPVIMQVSYMEVSDG